MKQFNEYITESGILLGKTVQMGTRTGRIIQTVRNGDTSRYDDTYLVKFQDGTKIEMHDIQIRPFLEEPGDDEDEQSDLGEGYTKISFRFKGSDSEREKIRVDLTTRFEKDYAGFGSIAGKEFDITFDSKKPNKIDNYVRKHYAKNLKESAPANGVGGGMSPHFGGEGDVQGTDGGKKKRKKFAGTDVFELSADEYHKCMHGRQKFERWSRKLNMEDITNQEIRRYAHKNPNKSIIIQDEVTGIMSYLTRK